MGLEDFGLLKYLVILASRGKTSTQLGFNTVQPSSTPSEIKQKRAMYSTQTMLLVIQGDYEASSSVLAV